VDFESVVASASISDHIKASSLPRRRDHRKIGLEVSDVAGGCRYELVGFGWDSPHSSTRCVDHLAPQQAVLERTGAT
jgi:hypothetical protein